MNKILTQNFLQIQKLEEDNFISSFTSKSLSESMYIIESYIDYYRKDKNQIIKLKKLILTKENSLLVCYFKKEKNEKI